MRWTSYNYITGSEARTPRLQQLDIILVHWVSIACPSLLSPLSMSSWPEPDHRHRHHVNMWTCESHFLSKEIDSDTSTPDTRPANIAR
ncbi:hypothetical protein XA68_18327 [Ophiocordyceps unilateralis]|uniref:Uncharacterized protein n=1 Tax=Ophiocordyceps unilateralis TaxID=268505 RepID=A0A2A9PJS2_OPHUN|nr:hypothetical protein XA68_18327 [Ophiocordyceps unilateralis]